MVNPVCASFFPYVFQSPQRAQNGKIGMLRLTLGFLYCRHYHQLLHASFCVKESATFDI